MDYLVKKDDKDVSTSDLNGIFSSIYGPIVPSKKKLEAFCYEKNQDKFEVVPFNEGSRLIGKISSDLIKKLSEFGISLQKEE
jgi:hypothetical protein